MEQGKKVEPDHTAVRVALWRAMHVLVDAPPHVLEDEIGFRLIAPTDDWRQRPDMDAEATKRIRASIVARSRFIEDFVEAEAGKEIKQYVILGAGLDTFAQRRPEIASQFEVYEIDQAETLEWKKQRLIELGYGLPKWLHFVPVDFEAGLSWWEQLLIAGFDKSQPAFVACTGVTMYLSTEAILSTLRRIASFAPGSKMAMSFLLPPELIDEEDRPIQQASEKGARAAGTPFRSYFTPQEMLSLVNEAGFKEARVTETNFSKQYFSGRTDGLTASNGEQFVLAKT